MTEVPPLPDEVRATLPPLAAAYVAALEAVVASVPALIAQITALQERVAALEARVGQTSANSSQPPSRDPPRARPAPKPAPDQRQPGGQPGHRGVFRVLTPAAQVTHTVRHVPVACAQCGMALSVPAGVPQGVVGPYLAATLALLTGRYRLSKREAAACLRDLVGVELAAGTVSAVEQQVSAALAPVVAEARAAVQTAAVANIDETSWRQGRQRAWLWTVVTALVTVFHIDRSRGSGVVRTLLGPDWSGIVGSDRFSAYRWLGAEGRQVCWAHLKRDFQKLVDWGPGPRSVGVRLLACHAQVFELWHRHRAGELDRAELLLAISRAAAEVRAVLEAGAATGHPV